MEERGPRLTLFGWLLFLVCVAVLGLAVYGAATLVAHVITTITDQVEEGA